MWKDDYLSGMEKLSASDSWRAETLRRMEQARPVRRAVFVKRAVGLTACAAALTLAVLGAWPHVTRFSQTAGGAAYSEAAMASREAPAPQTAQAPKLYDAQDTILEADATPLQGTVLSWTEQELVLDVEGQEQHFLLDANSEVDPDALTEGAAVQVYWEWNADGVQYATQVQTANG